MEDLIGWGQILLEEGGTEELWPMVRFPRSNLAPRHQPTLGDGNISNICGAVENLDPRFGVVTSATRS